MSEERTRIVSLKDRRLQKQFSRALETMERRMMWWTSYLREGDHYITVDGEGMVYGELIRFMADPAERKLDGPALMAEARQWTAARPEGWNEDIFTAQVWGMISEEQFERAKKLSWPAARGRFLDEVVTEDPRYTIWYTYADYTPPEEQ